MATKESVKEMYNRFTIIEDADFTNRLIHGGEDFEYPEWVAYGVFDDGTPVACYYRTTPDDQELVDDGYDWEYINWENRIDRFEECDEGGCPFRVIAS